MINAKLFETNALNSIIYISPN